MRLWFLCIVACILAHAAFPPAASSDNGPRLVKAVVLSRHGVRAPTQSEKILDMWTKNPWPDWPVARGDLTPRGAALAKQMWRNMHAHFSRMNLLPENICASPGTVYVRADVDERTKATAKAIVEGLANACDLGFAVLMDAHVDPLFHPLKAGLYKFNAIACATDVLAMTNGGLSAVQERLSREMSAMAEIMGPAESNLCTRFTMSSTCSLSDLPNAISISPNGEEIRLVGALDIASSTAEIFLLEYAEWPGQNAGWGKVSDKTLVNLLPLHATVFDIVNRAREVAWAKGSALLVEMMQALTGHHADARCNDARLVVFVGHDTNIANVGSLLNLSWQVGEYPQNSIPPAAALVLELWDNNGAQEIVARFFAQPVKTLHEPHAEDAGKDFTAFAPEESLALYGNATRLTREEFVNLVRHVTDGAPLAPKIDAPYFYGNVEPKP